MKIIISAKCSDLFSMEVVDNKNKSIHEYNGYVPNFFPDQHFGDYVMLEIDVRSGKILNWTATKQSVLNFIKE